MPDAQQTATHGLWLGRRTHSCLRSRGKVPPEAWLKTVNQTRFTDIVNGPRTLAICLLCPSSQCQGERSEGVSRYRTMRRLESLLRKNLVIAFSEYLRTRVFLGRCEFSAKIVRNMGENSSCRNPGLFVAFSRPRTKLPTAVPPT